MSRLEQILEGGLAGSSEIVSERLLRRVFRCRLDDGLEVFAKQHLFPLLRLRLRYAFRASPTQREAKRLKAAMARGLRVPDLLAERSSRGLLGPKLAVLVTKALPSDGIASHAERIAATATLAKLGIEHPDLHPDNVLILESGELAFLDFQSVRMHRRPVAGAALLRMRAKAAEAALAELGVEGLRDLLAAQMSPEEVAATLGALDRIRARQRASQRRHALRSSSRFERERFGLAWRVRIRGLELGDWSDEDACFVELEGGVRAAILAPDLLVLRARTRYLRDLWLRAALGQEFKAFTFLAYQRDAPWPWARERLYIRPHRILRGDADVLACWEPLRPSSGS
ncbi:MAG: hypothetical protein CSA62_14245 [Planctomycetota bacterium]|nr:MAG: hypothetical protein CSA62_14245 [Planctomycetota bacterium]